MNVSKEDRTKTRRKQGVLYKKQGNREIEIDNASGVQRILRHRAEAVDR